MVVSIWSGQKEDNGEKKRQREKERERERKYARIICQRLSSHPTAKIKPYVAKIVGPSLTCFPHAVSILIPRVIARPIPVGTLTWKERRAAHIRDRRSVNPLQLRGFSLLSRFFFTLPLFRNCQIFHFISTSCNLHSRSISRPSKHRWLITPLNARACRSRDRKYPRIKYIFETFIDLAIYRSNGSVPRTHGIIDC